MRFDNLHRWVISLTLAAFMVYAPYLYYRYSLEHSKRLRPVVDGKLYRSGCLTADGFRDAIRKHKIKTMISFWDEDTNPELRASRFSSTATRESELCKELGVHFQYIFIELVPDKEIGKRPQRAIEEFLKIMDDENAYPVLIHCKAGLHRTGIMTAIYRMEYDGWSQADALRELKSHGFGHFIANTSNEYITQYLLRYQPRRSRTVGYW